MDFQNYKHYSDSYRKDHPNVSDKKIWKSYRKRIIQRGSQLESFQNFMQNHPGMKEPVAWSAFQASRGGAGYGGAGCGGAGSPSHTPQDDVRIVKLDTSENIVDDITESLSSNDEPSSLPFIEEPTVVPIVKKSIEEPTKVQVVKEPTDVPIVREPTDTPILGEPTIIPIVEEPTITPIVEEPTVTPIVEEPTVTPIVGKSTAVPDIPVVEKPTAVPDIPVKEKPTNVPDIPVVEETAVIPVIEKPTDVPDIPVIEKPTAVPDIPVDFEKQTAMPIPTENTVGPASLGAIATTEIAEMVDTPALSVLRETPIFCFREGTGKVRFKRLYPKRTPVNTAYIDWMGPSSAGNYIPSVFTLCAGPFHMTDIHRRCTFLPSEKAFRTTHHEIIRIGNAQMNRYPEGSAQADPCIGKPLYPKGRTGIAGCGSLPLWGPNPHCYALFTRKIEGKWNVLLEIGLEGHILNVPSYSQGESDSDVQKLQYAFLNFARSKLSLLSELESQLGSLVPPETPFRFPSIAEAVLPAFHSLYRALENIVWKTFTTDKGCLHTIQEGCQVDPRNTDNAWVEGCVYLIDLEDQPSCIQSPIQWEAIQRIAKSEVSSNEYKWVPSEDAKNIPECCRGNITKLLDSSPSIAEIQDVRMELRRLEISRRDQEQRLLHKETSLRDFGNDLDILQDLQNELSSRINSLSDMPSGQHNKTIPLIHRGNVPSSFTTDISESWA